MVTQSEIARQLGLDVSSVNKILNRRNGPVFRNETVKRVFDVDGFACPHCGKAMVLRAVSVRPPATWQLLSVLGRGRGPPVFVD